MRTFAKKHKPSQHPQSASPTRSSPALTGQGRAVHSIAHLHHAIGNQAILRYLQNDAGEVGCDSDASASTRFIQDFSRIPIYGNERCPIQTKLTVSTPGDINEQEADRISEQVMRMPDPEQPDREPAHLHTTRINATGSGQIETPSIVHEVLAAPGQPLNSATRKFMEPRFGYDFGQVRVHADEKAGASARIMNALAYTSGTDIVFGRQTYRPGTSIGKQLLAHELVHVIQQDTGEFDSRRSVDAPVRLKPIHRPGRTTPNIIQREPLPRQRFESFDYTVRRLISELNDHLDNGRNQEARALVPQIQNYMQMEALAWDYADDAAAAFLRLGMVGEGVSALQAGRAARFGLHGRYSYSLRAVQMLFEAGERHMQANEYQQAWQAYESVFNWLENRELSRDPLGTREEPTGTVRQWYPRIIGALFSIPSRLRSEGNPHEADRYLTQARDLVIGSEATHRYGEDAARAFISAGRTEDAFAVLRNAEPEFPDTNPLIAYSEQAVTVLLESGDQAVEQQNWDLARQIYVEALRWVDEHSDVLGETFYNLGNERNVVARSVDRIMRGLLAIAIHYQQETITAFENNAQDAPQRLQTARAEIDRMRRLVPERMNNVVIIAEIQQQAPESETATYHGAFVPTRELSVTRYGGQDEFENRLNTIERILDTLSGQTATIEQFYVTDSAIVTEFETCNGRRPDIHSIEDRRLFWELKYNHLLTGGLSRQQALQALINSIEGYLQAFTFHTEYNIPDTFEHALSPDFPRTTTNQALLDCGIFAMRTAFELSLIRDAAQIDFHYVFIPQHVYLGIIDRGNAFGWALSNNRINEIENNIATAGIATAVADEFNLIPSDVAARQITSFTESGLRRELRQAGRGLNLPPNYRSLDSSARSSARRRSRDLSAQYTRIVDQISEQSARLRVLFNILGAEHNALSTAPTQEFYDSAEQRILSMYRVYVTISRDMLDYLTEGIRVLGSRSGNMSASLSFYFFNMDLAMNYVVHAIGRQDLASDEFIQDPMYQRIERVFGFQYQNVQRNYQGTPPPWDLARWERR